MDDPAVGRLARIERRVGAIGLADRLAALPAPDLQSLLLEVDRRRVTRRSPSRLVAQHTADPTVTPATADARRMHAIESTAFAAAGAFDAVDLAPVCPFGLNHVLGGVDVRNVLATVRTSEVVADPTSVQALEAARRRRAGGAHVRLSSTHRVLRLQPFPAGFLQHFRLFALTSAARETADHGFQLRALDDHLRAHLGMLAALERDGRALAARVAIADAQALEALLDAAGTTLEAVRRTASTMPDRPPAEALEQHGVRLPDAELRGAPPSVERGPLRRLVRVRDAVLPALREAFPGVELRFDLSRLHAVGYYDGLMLGIDVTGPEGPAFIADGGAVPWARRLLSDRREGMLTSGLGIDRLAGVLAAT